MKWIFSIRGLGKIRPSKGKIVVGTYDEHRKIGMVDVPKIFRHALGESEREHKQIGGTFVDVMNRVITHEILHDVVPEVDEKNVKMIENYHKTRRKF